MSLCNGMKVLVHLRAEDGCHATATITAYHPGSLPGVGSWYEAEIAPGAVVALDPEDEGGSWDREE